MRSRLLVIVSILGSAASVWSAAWAADSVAPSVAEVSTEVHLVQRAEKDLPRDRIHASLRAEAEGADPAMAQAEVNELMTKALTLARSEASVKAETSGYSVYQEPSNAKALPPKWRASQSMTMTGKDFAAVLSLVGTLQTSGMLVEGLNFDLAPDSLSAVEDELTAQALTDLRARAERVAADMTMSVERYKTIEIGNATSQGFRPPMPMFAKSAMAAPAASPVGEAGDSTVSVTVEAQVIMTPTKAP